jgi:hypothetical protein
MGWAPRGKAIDKLLGNNLGDNFPVVDKLANRNLTSIKSYDLTLKSNPGGKLWFNSLKRDIDVLNKFTERTWNGVTVRKAQYDTFDRCLSPVEPNFCVQSRCSNTGMNIVTRCGL